MESEIMLSPVSSRVQIISVAQGVRVAFVIEED